MGAGTGYYSAIIAEQVGPGGRVTAIEILPELARRTRENLADRPNVRVLEGDGSQIDPGPADAFIINAGATHPRPQWLDQLRPGGRLLLPLTTDPASSGFGGGGVLLVTRTGGELAARFVSSVGIYSCVGARDADENDQRLGKVRTFLKHLSKEPGVKLLVSHDLNQIERTQLPTY